MCQAKQHAADESTFESKHVEWPTTTWDPIHRGYCRAETMLLYATTDISLVHD